MYSMVRVRFDTYDGKPIFKEPLLIITNYKVDVSIQHPILALWRSQRYFIERTIQDTKSELG